MMMAAALHVDRKDATAQILTIGGGATYDKT